MLRLLRFPARTTLYVKPEHIVAISEYKADVRGVGVVHIANDAREAVWGDVEDLRLVLLLVEAGKEGTAQISYDGRAERAMEDLKTAVLMQNQREQQAAATKIPAGEEANGNRVTEK